MTTPDEIRALAIDDLRETFRFRPTEGTRRENIAWMNGFREALEAAGFNPAEIIEIEGGP